MRQAPALALLVCAASAASAAPTLSADRSTAVLGETKSLTLTVVSDAELNSAASSGTLVHIGSEGDRHTYRWTLPESRFPTTALFAFWERASDQPDIAVLAIPLHGRTTLEMDTEPGADVHVQVGGSSFGPVKANAKGRVKVPIEVPPGARTAQVIAIAKGQQTARSVPLDVPKAAPYAIALGPDPLPAAGGWIALLFPASFDARSFRVAVDGGAIADPVIAPGKATWRVRPAPGAATKVTLSITSRDPTAEPRTVSVTVGERRAQPPIAAPGLPITPHALVGAFFSGGKNTGFALELGASGKLAAMPRWLSLEGAVGLRQAWVIFPPSGPGSTDSNLQTIPILLGARARMFDRGAFAVDVRASAGPLPFRHTFTADFQAPFTETGVGFEVGVGPALMWRLGPLWLTLDLRAAFTQIRTARLLASPGGLIATLGAKYQPLQSREGSE